MALKSYTTAIRRFYKGFRIWARVITGHCIGQIAQFLWKDALQWKIFNESIISPACLKYVEKIYWAEISPGKNFEHKTMTHSQWVLIWTLEWWSSIQKSMLSSHELGFFQLIKVTFCLTWKARRKQHSYASLKKDVKAKARLQIDVSNSSSHWLKFFDSKAPYQHQFWNRQRNLHNKKTYYKR